MQIPLLDLAAQFATIENDLVNRVVSVLRSQQYILGPEVGELERAVASLCGVKHAVGVASGTDALILSLKALGLPPGGEVITTPFTFYASASSIVHAGGVPVFADIDPATCLIRPDLIEKAVTPRTRGIIPVHLFGQCAEMDEINAIARERGLFVLEDACQSVLAGYKGERAGGLGDAGALSFYPSKNLGGVGDGGMALTNSDEVEEKLRLLRVHGAAKQYHHDIIGYNSRLDSVQAAALLAKVGRIEEWTRLRNRHAEAYRKRLAGCPARPLELLPGRDHVYNNFVIRAPRRDQLIAHLTARRIGSAVYYPEPLHRMGCFAPYSAGQKFPASEASALECLAIPVYPEMTEEMVNHVAESIAAFYGS